MPKRLIIDFEGDDAESIIAKVVTFLEENGVPCRAHLAEPEELEVLEEESFASQADACEDPGAWEAVLRAQRRRLNERRGGDDAGV